VWAVAIPPLKARLDLSYGQVGLTLLALGISSLIAMSASGRLMAYLGERRLLTIGGIAFTFAATGPALARSWGELLTAVVVIGLCNGSIDASMNALVVDVERRAGRPIINSFHAWFSAGGLLAAGAGGIVLGSGFSVSWLLAAAAALALLLLLGATAWLPAVQHSNDGGHKGGQVRPPLRNRRIIVIGLVALAMFTAEGAAYDWSNLHLRDTVGASPQVAAAGFGAFSLAMMLMRLIADRVVARVGAAQYVRVATLVAATGFGLAIISTTAPIAILGWLLAGIGIAGCVPLTFSAAGNVDPQHSSTYVSRVAALGYCGFLAGPSLLGFLAEVTNLRVALIIPVLCCVVVTGAAGVLRSPTGRQETRDEAATRPAVPLRVDL
jgi:MFS family permease